MNKDKFEIKPEHLKLLQNMYVDWNDCEYGAPEIDPKRPYGNSSVELDILEILYGKTQGKITIGDEDYEINSDDWKMPDKLTEKLAQFHKETQIALQICLSLQKFETGKFEREPYVGEWKKVE